MNEEDPGVRHAYQADYIYWLRKDYWGPEEASILLAGYSPEEFPRGDAKFETFGSKVDAIHLLAADDIGSKKIPVRNAPADWIAWFLNSGLTLPDELDAVIGNVETLPTSASTSVTTVPQVITHSTKERRDILTPVIELAQKQCRDPRDAAEVWAVLQVLAEKGSPPLFGATEDGLQYFKEGIANTFKRKSLGQRLKRLSPRRTAKA
jgi:hypothetical protein